MTVDQRMLSFAASQHAGLLATLKRDGRPQVSNLFYTWDDEQQLARIQVTAGSAKARNLQPMRGRRYT